MVPSPPVTHVAWLLLFLGGTTVCGACKPAVDDDDSGDPELHGTVEMALNPNNRFAALVTVEMDGDADVIVEYGTGGGFELTTPSRAVEAGTASEMVVLGLRADTEYELRVTASDGSSSWTGAATLLTTEPLPEGWPTCQISFGVDPTEFDDREIICTDGLLADGTPIYQCFDRNGVPLWELRHPDGETIRHVEPLSDGDFLAVGFSDSFLAIFDAAGRMTAEYTGLWFQGKTRFEHQWINQHDAIEITEGPWTGAVALLTNAIDDVNGEPMAGGGVIVLDRHTGEVLWDWSVHGEMGDDVPIDPALGYERYGLYQESGTQWLHANALLHGVDDQGQQFLWISLRAQDWIIKLDVATDAIVWRLGYGGDFELVDDLEAADPAPLEPNQWMFQQHAPEWQSRDGSRSRFVVFDNGNVRPDPLPDGGETYSRVVAYEIDEVSQRAAITFELGDPDPGSADHFASNAYGDADMLPGGEALLMDVGLIDPNGAYIAEIGYPGGEERWRYDCPQGPTLYQANYHPDLYEMTWKYEAQR